MNAARLRPGAWPAEPPQWRPMHPCDLPAVHEVELLAYSHPWTLGNFADSLSALHWTEICLGAVDEVRGYSVAMPALDELHLLNLTVAPPWQGRGLAAILLERLGQRARLAGVQGILLEVRPSNLRAIALYERRGFVEIGRRRGYYPAGEGEREDAVMMRLCLTEGPSIELPRRSHHALD